MDNKQKHIYVAGLVQGVGFRLSVRILADKNNIKGWVRNLPDNRVEMFIQGSDRDISVFLKELKNDFKENITDFVISESKDCEKYTSFNISI